MNEKTYYYRVEETTYSAGCDEWGDPLPGGPTRTNICKFEVVKRTPQGVWLDTGDIEPKLVLNCWNKRYACPTIEEAKASFIARKRRQILLAESTIRRAKEAMRYMGEKGFNNQAWFDVDIH